jgi:hypothetical protein
MSARTPIPSRSRTASLPRGTTPSIHTHRYKMFPASHGPGQRQCGTHTCSQAAAFRPASEQLRRARSVGRLNLPQRSRPRDAHGAQRKASRARPPLCAALRHGLRSSSVAVPGGRSTAALSAHVCAPVQVPRRDVIVALACANVVKAQGETPRPDTAHNCAPGRRLTIAVDLPVD